MRFLYIAPRYHTNQIPIVRGLQREGHEVIFLSQYAGKLEDYSEVTPVVIGYSSVYMFFDKIYMRLMHKKNVLAGDKKIKCGVPKLRKLARHIKASGADVAILRERSVYSIFAYLLCKKHKIPAILYNQSPLWEDYIKNDLPHRLMRKLTPRVRMTPVLGTPGPDKVKEPGAVFVPFVMEPVAEGMVENVWRATEMQEGDKDSCVTVQKQNADGQSRAIEIFCIGKYEKRKNHRMMLEIMDELLHEADAEKENLTSRNIHLTIAGECTSGAHQEYYRGLEAFIREKGLEKHVMLLKNLTREQVNERYKKSDLFVIPSTAEPASISQLEAMAYGLPVICSDKNGTACYVEHKVNGYHFSDNQKASLKEVLASMLSDTHRMQVMGRKSLELIKEKYQIDSYLKGIYELMDMLS